MAIQLSKNGNAVKFDFDDNSHYLNDGTIEVPVNSLTLVTDESDMFTFKKAASDDIFISGLYSEIGMSKAELIAWYKDNMVGSTGGGGGVTSGEVQTMIDESVSGLSDDISTVSGATESLHSAVTELSGQVNTDEKVTATALNALNNGLSGATASINNVSSTLNNHTGNSQIHISSEDRDNWDSKVGYEDVTNKVQKDSNELVKGGGIFNKVAYTTSGSAVVTGKTTNTRIGLVRSDGRWTNAVESIQNWCLDGELPEDSCDLEGGELRMSFNNDISELDITIGDLSNSFTVRYDSNEDNLEADNATVEWADATTKREIIITDYPTIILQELDGELTADATVVPVEEITTYVRLKYVYSSEQTIETTHWVVDEIKNKVDKTEFEARLAEDEEVTAAALNTLNTALGGLKLVQLTQAQYDLLPVKDPNTLYIITNVVN